MSTPDGPQCLTRELAKFDKARWSVAVREMQIRVLHGNHEAAVRILREFCANTSATYATLDSMVGDVLPVRIANLVEAIGCDTVRSLDKMSDRALAAIPNMGDTTIGLIRRTIQNIKAGRVLAMTSSEAESLVDEEYIAMPEHRIYMLVLEAGPLRVSAISKQLGLTELEISDAFHRSKRLTKVGGGIGVK